MAPIRLAIIGLSSGAKTAWASQAHLPYLLSARGRSKYEIIALCNTSVEAAKKSVEVYQLPSTTRTYGDPEALARDPDVELVVDCTRVDVHYPTILPSVKAGKNVYVEWPLAQDAPHARELTQIAQTNGSRTIVGLQGRLAPPVVKIRDLLHQGRIGKVLSSQIRAFGGLNSREHTPSSLAYFLDPAVGGNVLTIGFGHLFDQIQYVLGDFDTHQGYLHLQRPENKLVDSSTKQVVDVAKSQVPDIIATTGTLSASAIAQQGAPVLTYFRRGQVFPGEPPLVWSIHGEKGEIRLRAEAGTSLHASAPNGPIVIELHDFETEKVEQIEWKWAEWQEELPIISRSVAAVYEAYADSTTDGLASFEEASSRHKQLGDLLSGWLETEK